MSEVAEPIGCALSAPLPCRESRLDRRCHATLLSLLWFSQAINHGLPKTLLDSVVSTGREMFALPKQEKNKFKVRRRPRNAPISLLCRSRTAVPDFLPAFRAFCNAPECNV